MSLRELTDPWVIVGFTGQAAFFSRMVVQWWKSEKSGQIVVPVSFWYMSAIGAAILLVYAIHIGDIVFSVAQSLGFLIYGRNLWIHHRGQPDPEESR